MTTENELQAMDRYDREMKWLKIWSWVIGVAFFMAGGILYDVTEDSILA